MLVAMAAPGLTSSFLALGDPAPVPLRDAIEQFLQYQQRRGRRPRTITHARCMLQTFCDWAGDDAWPGEIDRRQIELQFMSEWQSRFQARNGRAPSVSTLRSLLLALKGLYAFLDDFDLLWNTDGTLARNPLRRIDVPPAGAPTCRVLATGDDDALLAAPRTPLQKIAVSLLRLSGLRAGEAEMLLDDDVDSEARYIRVRIAKTARGRRTIPLVPALEPAIAEWRSYCEDRGLRRPTGPFLPTRHGTPVQAHYLWKCVRDVAARAGITTTDGSAVTPHTLRRTFATDLLNRGVRLEVVSRLLGHASTTITEQAYAVLSDERMRYEVEAALAPPAGTVQLAPRGLARLLRELSEAVADDALS